MNKSKEKILASAKELFHENGFQQTSVDEILKKSGVTKSNFYYHFKSKEELGLIILDRFIQLYESDVLMRTLGNKELTPSDRLTEFYRSVRTFHRDLEKPRGCPFGNMAIEMSGSNESFREKLSVFFNSWEKIIEECISEGMRSGDFRGDLPPGVIAQLILSHLEGAIMMVKTHRSIEPLSSGSETILRLLKAA
ncbi:MAG: TetR/AcrR family transcriptional regulator [Candidatus Dadabacteria bacterium]|nr:MAG: TetR/AcrR family transcriptional regulator [Candidatus Dadabacteria bacterium]